MKWNMKTQHSTKMKNICNLRKLSRIVLSQISKSKQGRNINRSLIMIKLLKLKGKQKKKDCVKSRSMTMNLIMKKTMSTAEREFIVGL